MRRLPFTAAAVSAFALWGLPASAAPTTATAPQNGATATPVAASQPGSPSLDDSLRHAQALRAQGNFAEATRLLSQLMLASPDDPRIVGEYGKSLAQQGRSQDAVAFLKRAAELKPGEWSVYSALGVAYDQMDDRKSAAAAYERALSLKPGDPTVLNNYAVSRMLAGDLDGAQRMLTQASASGGGYSKIANNLGMVAQMKSAKAGAAAAATGPVQPKPTAIAQAKAPAAGPSKVATASLPTPKASRTADSAPASLTPPGATSVSQPATVVMQQVPVDPLAGPVAKATPAPHKLTNKPAVKTRLAKAPAKPAAPVLRTADQGE
jgi:Flp pilus assembly protein TadD